MNTRGDRVFAHEFAVGGKACCMQVGQRTFFELFKLSVRVDFIAVR